jgi:hypothetical protein
VAKAESSSLSDVVIQLKITNRLLVFQLKASGAAKQIELIALLDGIGATAQDIANVLDTTPSSVRGALFRLRQKKGGPIENVESE